MRYISLSCQRGMFSKAAILFDLMILAIPEILSESSGFLLCGIEEEPLVTNPFVPKGSLTSFTSLL